MNDFAQLTALADALVDEIGAARQQLSELQRAVRELEGDAEPEAVVGAPMLTGEASSPDTTAADRFTAAPDGARLVALNLALSGASRDETREHLMAAFSIDHVEELLDDAFGVSYADEPRVPRRRRFGRRLRGA